MHHNLIKTCNGRTQDLPGIVQLFWSGTPPKNCDNRFFVKTDESYVKIWNFDKFEKIMIFG